MILVKDRLEDRVRETNDQNPPDNPDDLEEEDHGTLFESFNSEEDDF